MSRMRRKYAQAITESNQETAVQIKVAAVKERDAAVYIGFTVAFLRAARLGRCEGPPFVRAGRRAVRYLIRDLDHWLESRRVAE